MSQRLSLPQQIEHAREQVRHIASVLPGHRVGGQDHQMYEMAVGRLQALEQGLRERQAMDGDFDRTRLWTRESINRTLGLTPLERVMHDMGARRIHHPSPVAVWNS